MRRFYALLLGLCLMLSGRLSAQELVVFSEAQHQHFEYALNTYNSTELSDYFVTEIAKGLPRNPDMVRYATDFDVVAKVIKYPKDFYKFQIQIEQFKTKGSVQYRGFDMSALIFPKSLKGKVVWKDRNTGAGGEAVIDVYQEGVYRDFLIWSKEIHDESSSASFTIDTFYLDFSFDSRQKEEFEKLTKAIDHYYDSGLMLDEIEAKIQRINLDNASMLMIYNIQLKNIRKELQKMHPENFYRDPSQLSYDPIGLGARYQSLLSSIDSLHRGIETQTEVLDVTYYKQAMHALEKEDSANAKRLFHRSVHINPYYSPSFYQLALLEMNMGALDTAVMHIRTILIDLKPDYEVKKNTIELASTCATLISTKALKLTREEAFNEAVQHLDVALLLCDSTPYVQCSEEVTRAMSEAKYGLYASYLSVARTALDHNLKMVEGYLDLAYRYQQDNQSYIVSSAEVDRLYKRLLEKYKQVAYNYLAANDYGYAISYSDKMDALCKRLSHLDCGEDAHQIKKKALGEIYRGMIAKSLKMMKEDGALSADMYLDDAIAFQKQYPQYIADSEGTDTILHRVKRDVYMQHVRKVQQYKDEEKESLAVNHIRMAKAIEEEFPTFRSEKLEGLVADLIVPVLLSDLRYPNTSSWGKYYRSAQSALNEVIRQKELYGIEDQRLQTAIDTTDYYIRITSCVDLKKDYQNEIRRANTHMQNGDYLNASKNWSKGLEIAQKNPYCELDTLGLQRYFVNYQPVIRFQQLKSQAESHYQTRQYVPALHAYWQTQKIADSMDLKRYRLYHIHFSSWVEGKLFDAACRDALLTVAQNEKAFETGARLWLNYTKKNPLSELNELQKAFVQAWAEQDVKNNKDWKSQDQFHFANVKNLKIIRNYYRYYYYKASGKALFANLLRMRYKIK